MTTTVSQTPVTQTLILEVFGYACRMSDEEGLPRLSVAELVAKLVDGWEMAGDAKLKAAVRRQTKKMADDGVLEEIEIGKRSKAFQVVPQKEEVAAESDELEAAFGAFVGDGMAAQKAVDALTSVPKAAAVQPETAKIIPMKMTPEAKALFDRTVSAAFDEGAFWKLCCIAQGRDYGGPIERRLQLLNEISAAGGTLDRVWTKREFRLLTVMAQFQMVKMGTEDSGLRCEAVLLDGGRCSMANEGMTLKDMRKKTNDAA